ncbi:MAG: type I phosphomannose isomerase catalytic subunit [Halanaerobium sp.]
MFYPLKFDHKYIEKVWGGRKLESFRSDLPDGKIGESWDISVHKDKLSIVKNGKLKGKSLKELTEMFPVQILGEEIKEEEFPFLFKIIDAHSQLSIQVHPDERYASKNKGESSKIEAWYIMDAEEDSHLIVGTKDCSESEFKKAVQNNEFNAYVNKIEVKKGDVFFIKPGLLHAVGSGVMVAEIQQSSDTTYRIYDYGRDRELHLAKALDVIDFKMQSKKRKGLKISADNYDYTYYCLHDKLAMDIIDIKKTYKFNGDRERFHILSVLEGSGMIRWEDEEMQLDKTDSLLIPAYLEGYIIEGKLKLMKSYLPDLEQTKNNILATIE